MSLARETDGDLEAGTEVDEEVEEANRVEEVNNRVEEVEGETEDFTSILLPVDSKERRVVLRRVSLIQKSPAMFHFHLSALKSVTTLSFTGWCE